MWIISSIVAFLFAVSLNAVATRVWPKRAPFSTYIVISVVVFIALVFYIGMYTTRDPLDVLASILFYAAATEFYVLLILLVGNSVSVSILIHAMHRPLMLDELEEMYSEEEMLQMRMLRLSNMGLIEKEGDDLYGVTPAGHRLVRTLDRVRHFFGHGSLLQDAVEDTSKEATHSKAKPAKGSSHMMRWVGLILKLVLSAILITYIYQKFGYDELLQDMSKVSAMAIVAVVVIEAVQIFIGAWRMRVLMEMYDEELGWALSTRLTFVGFFFSQTFVSFIGGDGMRIWLMMRNGFTLHVSGHAVMADRILGFLMLLVLILLGLPFALSMTEGVLQVAMVLIALASIVGCLAFFFVNLLPYAWHRFKVISHLNEQAMFCRKVLSKRRAFSASFMLPHVLNTAILYVFLIDYGADINFLFLLCLVPPVFLLSMLPISFAGWGVREGALVAVLGSLGVQTHVIVAASIAFGIAHIIASFPGLAVWLVDARRTVK